MQIDPESLTGNWNYPTSVRFGPGRLVELSAVCTELGLKRPLLVTDPGLAALPLVQDVVDACGKQGLDIAVFSDIQPNPRDSNVVAGVEAFDDGKHDGVIAFGGGSALDAGKAIAFMTGQSRPIGDFEDIGDNWQRADTAAIAPIIAIPTTAGTGSEVGRAAIIADDLDGRKRVIFHPAMMAKVVIDDPKTTLALPPPLTAATGLDAFIHNFEAYCAPGYHPLADGIALEGMRLLAEWLPVAYAYGDDMQARSHVLAAASMGATAFQKGLGGVHAISHAVGSLYGTHHGLTNAVVLPYILQHNADAIGQQAQYVMRLIGAPKHDVDALTDFILEFRKTLEIPNTLQDIGVSDDRADAVAQLAYDDPTRPGNPKPLTSDDLRTIFVNAVRGVL